VLLAAQTIFAAACIFEAKLTHEEFRSTQRLKWAVPAGSTGTVLVLIFLTLSIPTMLAAAVMNAGAAHWSCVEDKKSHTLGLTTDALSTHDLELNARVGRAG
jgi:tryptophan-rich sensory protein